MRRKCSVSLVLWQQNMKPTSGQRHPPLTTYPSHNTPVTPLQVATLWSRDHPANTKHLHNICTKVDQCRRRWADVLQLFYKCFVFAVMPSARISIMGHIKVWGNFNLVIMVAHVLHLKMLQSKNDLTIIMYSVVYTLLEFYTRVKTDNP